MDGPAVVYAHNGILLSLIKETLTRAARWMGPEAAPLSEISQAQKHKYCTMPHCM